VLGGGAAALLVPQIGTSGLISAGSAPAVKRASRRCSLISAADVLQRFDSFRLISWIPKGQYFVKDEISCDQSYQLFRSRW
jgi:hypothetical protein